jgi:hypothetical protein
MFQVEIYGSVRRAVLVEGRSRRAVAREYGISRTTVDKMLRYSVPPGYQRQQPIKRPKLGPWLGVIDAILAGDKQRPKKQHHAGRRLHGAVAVPDDRCIAPGCGGGAMSNQPDMPTPDTPQLLLEHHLKTMRLPTILREYDKVARQCAAEKVDFPRYLLRLTELELVDRDRRAIERRIRQAKFSVVKSLDSFDFLSIPSANMTLVLDLARGEFIARKENVLLLGNSGTGKTHLALALGLAACQRSHRVRFTTHRRWSAS